MVRSRLSFTAGLVVLLLSAAGLAAVAAGPANPPPRIAFVARGDGTSFADALTVGPVAGQLGAPLFTATPTTLPAESAAALQSYAPELVIVAGGTAAVGDAVMTQIRTATGLPADKVIRAFGANRYGTAAALSDLLSSIDGVEYDPAYLPITDTAADSDLLDGLDSTAFLRTTAKAADSDLLDGLDSTAFLRTTAKAADANLLDGLDSTAFRKVSDPVDAATLGGLSLGALDLRYAAAVERVIPVAASGSAASNGSALRTAYDGVFGATADAPYVILLGPGTFDLGAARLDLQDNVHIVGSGRSATVVTGDGADAITNNAGLLGGADVELRHLTLVATGGENVTGVRNFGGDLRLRDVRLDVTVGAVETFGLEVVDGSIDLHDVEITLDGGIAIDLDAAGVDVIATLTDVSIHGSSTLSELWGIRADIRAAGPSVEIDAHGLDIELTTQFNAWGVALLDGVEFAGRDVSIAVDGGGTGFQRGFVVNGTLTGSPSRAEIQGLRSTGPDVAVSIASTSEAHEVIVRGGYLAGPVNMASTATGRLALSYLESTTTPAFVGPGGPAGSIDCFGIHDTSYLVISCP